MQVTAKTWVNLPLEQTWAEFNDKEQSTQWVKSLVRIDKLEGETLQAGTVYNYIYQEGKGQNEMREEIERVDAPNRIESLYSTKVMQSQHAFSFAKIDDNTTEVTGEMDLQPTNFIMKLMLRFLKGPVRKRLKEDLERFSALMNEKHNSSSANNI